MEQIKRNYVFEMMAFLMFLHTRCTDTVGAYEKMTAEMEEKLRLSAAHLIDGFVARLLRILSECFLFFFSFVEN